MNDLASVNSPSDFHHITARLKMPLAPVFLTKTPSKADPTEKDAERVNNDDLTNQTACNGPLEAVNQSIASLLMKYIPSLGSVLVSYLQPPVFILPDPYGRPVRIVADKAHQLSIPTVPGVGWGSIDVEVKLMGWRPTIGQKLIGRPTLSSPSHLSLVVYQTFNATIHENHLKSAGCYYDLNVQVPRSWKNPGADDAATEENPWDPQPDSTADEHRECGCWVDADGNVIGGEDGTVSFTVISLTVANHMISVIGSLLEDPFSIDPGIPANQSMAENAPLRAQSDEDSSSEDEEEEEVPNNRRISNKTSKSLTRIESPPPVKATRKTRSSRKISQKPKPTDLSDEDDDDTINVERPVRSSTRSRQKNPKKNVKRSAPEFNHDDDEEDLLLSSSPPPPPPKRRKSSVKPKVSSTPKKKQKTK